MRINRSSALISKAALLALALIVTSAVGSAQSTAPVIVVNTTSNLVDFGGPQQVGNLPGPDGLVSLAEAIIAANNTPGPQVIVFHIPVGDPGFAGGVFTIKPPLGFSLLDNGTTIDGTTQTAFTGDTNPSGPEIVLDGSAAASSAGIDISNSSNHTIRGLVIHSFLQAGIQFTIWQTGSPDHNRIAGCYIGTDATGTVALGNGWQGIALNGNGNVIGGADPADRNVIAGNSYGISEIQVGGPNGPVGVGNVVEGNFIGTDRTGTVALGVAEGVIVAAGTSTLIKGNLISGNNGTGVHLAGGNANVVQGNLIGTNASGKQPLPNRNPGLVVDTAGNFIASNVIAFNLGAGVLVSYGAAPAASANISQNSIFSNVGLGIDLGGDGVTLNDPGDLDSGPNDLMNFPVLESAHATPGRLVVKGTIDTADPRSVTIELFANPAPVPGADPSGYGEGAVFLGSVRPNHKGDFTAPVSPVPPGTYITATATDAAGNTSEFAVNIVAK